MNPIINAFSHNIGFANAPEPRNGVVCFSVDKNEELAFQEQDRGLSIDYQMEWRDPPREMILQAMELATQPPYISVPIKISLSPANHLTASMLVSEDAQRDTQTVFGKIDILLNFHDALTH